MLIACGANLPSFAAEIRLGMSAAFEGPAKEIGIQLREGAALYFDAMNAQGGINQQTIRLIALDDGYEPQKTILNSKAFIHQYKVHALFTYMGTPTTWAIKSLLEYSKVPLITPFTGADFLRSPESFRVVNLRASYQQEAEEQIQFLVNEHGKQRIALFIQADEFGLTMEKSLVKVLAQHHLQPVLISRFRRNTEDIDKALRKILQSDAQAIAMVGTYSPLAEFVNKAGKANPALIYTTVSFASSIELYRRITQPVTLMSSEVMPDPSKCKTALCASFQKLAQTKSVKPTRLAFEGFVNAYLTSKAIEQCEAPLQQSCLYAQLQTIRKSDRNIVSMFGSAENENNFVVFRSNYQ
ncbi:ABC transporter substrate-binding protein [Pseudoalteromonas fenneropenaei]|uniref:ABC transporter substrate-binding protein n=1 Tax=Pseudoalteromonas fenneropenaei TaxID=1737459 RepID=A0ABV7CQE2_9GAMM